MDAILAGWRVRRRADALAGAIRRVARDDPALARWLLGRMHGLLLQTKRAARSDRQSELDWVVERFAPSAVSVIRAVGPDEPAGALSIARQVEDTRGGRGESRSLALALAAGFQRDSQTADRVFDEAMQIAAASRAPVAAMAHVAALAFASDAGQGRDFAAQTERRFEAMEKERDAASEWLVADFAFHTARLDPARSRTLIEAAFARQRARVEATSRNADWSRSQEAYPLLRLARAMAAVDIERALELSDLIAGKYRERGARRAIVLYALLPHDERATLALDEWFGRGDW